MMLLLVVRDKYEEEALDRREDQVLAAVAVLVVEQVEVLWAVEVELDHHWDRGGMTT